MKHFLLLMTSLFILTTFESCGGDKAPSGDLATVVLQDGYLGACGNELLSMHVHITVDQYSNNSYEGIYWEDEFDTNNTQHFFYDVAIPSSGRFQVTMEIDFNDCTSCCYGSCYNGGGKPSFFGATNMLDAPANGQTLTILPTLQSCN